MSDLITSVKQHMIKNSSSMKYMINKMKDYGIFVNVVYKDIIHFSIKSFLLREYKFGKIFKESPNGIIDFIEHGVVFKNKNAQYYNDAEGFGIFNINTSLGEFYCYYNFNTGGCPSCGFGSEYGKPEHVVLYISESIEDLVINCMSKYDRENSVICL